MYRDPILHAYKALNIVRNNHLWASKRSIQRSALTWTNRRKQPAEWRRGWFLQTTKTIWKAERCELDFYFKVNDGTLMQSSPILFMVGRLWDTPFVGILLCLATRRGSGFESIWCCWSQLLAWAAFWIEGSDSWSCDFCETLEDALV